MPYQFVQYNIFLLLSALITSALGVYGYRHRAAPGAKAFVAGMCIGTLWSVANALEVSALTLEHKLFWANVQYIAYALAPVSWITMVLQFSEKARWVKKRNILLLLIVPTITCFLVWTDPLYGLVRHNINLDTAGPFAVIAKEYSPWFWVHFLHSYSLNFLSLFLLLKTVFWSKNSRYRTQSVLLLAGTGLIAVFNLMYITGIGPAMRRDISPIIFSVSGVIIAWGIFRFHLFNLVPIARNKVIEAMKNMVIVIDVADRIVDLNRAAQELFARNDQVLIGKTLNQLSEKIAAIVNQGDKLIQHQMQFSQSVKNIYRFFEIRVSPIMNYKGTLMGRVIVINDITEFKKVQDELIREQQELVVMAERDRMAKDLHDNLGQIFNFAGIQIQAVQMERQRGNHELADSYLKRLGEIIEEAHREMRDYVYNTRADEYRKNNIEKLIKNQVRKFVDNSNNFSEDDIILKLHNYEFPAEVKMHLISIIKEALNNIMKHACATAVKVTLGKRSGCYELVIEDNGLGFENSNLSDGRETGSGLCIMEERARLLGGSMKIDSTPGKCTKIIVQFPDSLGGQCHENNDS